MENKNDNFDNLALNRTEQINNIVERMPVHGSKCFFYIALGLTGLMIFFSVIIKYPETVSGEITITMRNAPLRIVSKTAGRINLLGTVPRTTVKQNEIFAVIDNPTNTSDLIFVDSILRAVNPDETKDLSVQFPTDMNLGELNAEYYSFINSYKQLCEFKQANTFQTREKNYLAQLETYNKILENNIEKQKVKEKQLEFYKKEIKRDSIERKIGSMVERDVERSRNNYDAMLENYLGIIETYASYEAKKAETEILLEQVKIERLEKERELIVRFRSDLNALYAAILSWKDRYAFQAPFDGTVEFLEFWHDNDFVSTGYEVFSLIPSDNSISGYLQLPSYGAGKVKPGQSVDIRLNDYPHLEYGSIKGEVQSVSLITNKMKTVEDKILDSYMIVIDLPEGLTTKFGSTLDFRYEIKGVADVQTQRRRLYERLFDNLKYSVSQ